MPAEGRDLLEWEQLGSQTSQFRCCSLQVLQFCCQKKEHVTCQLPWPYRQHPWNAFLSFFFNLCLPHTLFLFLFYVYVVGTLSLYSCVKFSSSYSVSTNIAVPFIFLSWVIALALELAVLDNFSDVSHPCLCTSQPRAFRHVPTRPWLLPEHWDVSTSHHYTPSREPTELFLIPWTNVF